VDRPSTADEAAELPLPGKLCLKDVPVGCRAGQGHEVTVSSERRRCSAFGGFWRLHLCGREQRDRRGHGDAAFEVALRDLPGNRELRNGLAALRQRLIGLRSPASAIQGDPKGADALADMPEAREDRCLRDAACTIVLDLVEPLPNEALKGLCFRSVSHGVVR